MLDPIDRAVWQEHLVATEQHIVEAEKRVASQREIIAELERDGHRTRVSRDNLDENGSDNQSLKWRPVAKA